MIKHGNSDEEDELPLKNMEGGEGLPNWMSRLPKQLQDIPLWDLALPGKEPEEVAAPGRGATTQRGCSLSGINTNGCVS